MEAENEKSGGDAEGLFCSYEVILCAATFNVIGAGTARPSLRIIPFYPAFESQVRLPIQSTSRKVQTKNGNTPYKVSLTE